MKLPLTQLAHAGDLVFLRTASLLVPAPLRAEWRKEWQSELWHIREVNISEREAAAFCFGAFNDALCLRQHYRLACIPLATTKGSARQCLSSLAMMVVISCGIAFALPGVRATLWQTQYRLPDDLTLIKAAETSGTFEQGISAEQFRAWKVRRQQLFDGFAFYRIVLDAESGVSIAHASSNIFHLLRIPLRFTTAEHIAETGTPRAILSDDLWRTHFNSEAKIAGRSIHIGAQDFIISGVAPRDSWMLPGKVSAWILEPAAQIPPEELGYVVAHRASTGMYEPVSGTWNMSAARPDGTMTNFLCLTLSDHTRSPMSLFFIAVLLACFALPATTPLALGEHLSSARKVAWTTTLRRYSFLAGKITLLLPVIYFTSLNFAYARTSLDALSAEYVQVVAAFWMCLFGLRWVLRDQRERCPVCLGKLTHPARVGQPSRNFLAWNGTELMCVGGHGLMHVPELSTSWFSTQRWMYLDASWDVLFAERRLASPH